MPNSLRLPSGRSERVRPDRAAVPCPAALPISAAYLPSLSRSANEHISPPRSPPPRTSLLGLDARAAQLPLASEYPEHMNESSSRSFGRTVVAGLVLLIAAWLLLHFVIGIVTAIASVVVVVLAIVAVIWALRVLL